MTELINTEPLLEEDHEIDSENDFDLDRDDSYTIHFYEESLNRHKVPYDRYNLAYIVFYLLGINTLIPWNFFITADDYWMYKFRKIKPNESQCIHFNHIENLNNRTEFQASFTSYISMSSAISNTIFLIINIFISNKISLSKRMIGSQCIVLVIFILTSSIAKLNTDEYQFVLVIITLTSVIIVNAASAIYGGSLLGIVGRFSSKYITAMSAGQALGGIFTALTEILSLWIGANPVISGLLYFIIGDIVLLLSLVAYIVLERQVFFKYHVAIENQMFKKPKASINNEIIFLDEQVSYLHVFKRTWHYGFSIFSIFFVTMIIYPSVTVLVESNRKGYGHIWNDIYFVPVVTYLIFSCGDYTGRVLSSIILWPRNKPQLLMFLSILRGLFIPAFLYCNVQPRHHLSVYIHDDVYYILLTVAFALSNGYLCNIIFILAPSAVNPKEKEIASSMLGAFLGIGLSVGSSLSLVMIKII